MNDDNYTREDVILRFCELSSKVMEHFDYKYAADCFCDEPTSFFRFEKEIMEFIETAVMEKIKNEIGLRKD